MSLLTDKIFCEALKANTDFMQAIGGRIWDTAIEAPDLEAENEPVPYCIVTFDGLNNQDSTKDDPYEGVCDTVNIGIELTAQTREELGLLARMVRKTIHNQFSWVMRFAELRDSEDFNLEDCDSFQLMVAREYDEVFHDIPYDYQFSSDAVQYDSMKPCYWQVLHYQCSCDNTIDYDDEQESNTAA
jgi:hypothetical protein